MLPKAIITGGTGYIGSNLLENLTEFDITVCDRTLKRENLSKPELYKYIQIDLCQEFKSKEFEQAILDSQIIIHSSFLGNFANEKNFIDYVAKRNPQIKFVYLSSAAVYGDLEAEYKENSHASFSEGSICKPINDYGRTKLVCEDLVKNTFANYLIIRIANPFGKEVSNKGMYKLFKTKLEAGERKLDLNADFPGQIIRDFIYIDELCKQVSNLITNQQTGVFNISSGSGRTLEDLIQELAQSLNINYQDIELNYADHKVDEIKVSILGSYFNKQQKSNKLLE